jgi:ribosomal protein S18 acetylase RimI-like enzyme
MIFIKDITKEDIKDVLEIRNDKSTRENLENNSKFTLQEGLDWYEKTKPTWKMISIQTPTSYYNNVGYLRIEDNIIGCDIHPQFRRMGIARKAYKELLPTKKEWELWVFGDNYPARDLYESLGFYYTGDQGVKRNKLYLHMRYKQK